MSRHQDPQPEAPARPAGLLAKLMATVRPEFRVEVLIPQVGDPILSGPPCAVAGCDRASRSQRTDLCRGHYQRWCDQDRPDLASFIATTPAVLYGHARLPACLVAGCQDSQRGQQLCGIHWRGWTRAGQPEVTGWAATVAVDPAITRPTCRLTGCEVWASARGLLCGKHTAQWRAWRRRTGCRDLNEFVEQREAYGRERFDFRALPPQLKLELQYAIQCRAEERRVATRPRDVAAVLRFVAQSGTRSLLDWSQQEWASRYLSPPGDHVAENARKNGLTFLRYARAQVADLVHGHGWDAEYPHDVWDLHRLGMHAPTRRLRFDRIPQPWLRDLAKRWARWQLSKEIGAHFVNQRLLGVTEFAGFLAAPSVGVGALAELSREVLERYLAHAASQPWSPYLRSIRVAAVHAFLVAIRQHRWAPGLPADAALYLEDLPKQPPRQPRALPEQVMAQIEQPDNLARLSDPTVRLATVILINTGLRIGDASRLAFDCIVRDGQDAPYLRYVNHKMQREALVPIDNELVEAIGAQQQRLLQRWPKPPLLLPRHAANPDGRWPLRDGSYRRQLARWLATCDVRDEAGRRVKVTPHQFRHVLGTRLANRDVPQEVIRVILDHDSHRMTAHYARLSDQTVRRHWEAARKVNIHGEPVTIQPDSPLADAQWVKHRVGLATQALPNGYCGLPIQRSCPHANACLTCPVFVTTPEFLDQHRQHRDQTRRLLATATATGQLRLAEMNQRVLDSLDRIIPALEAAQDPQTTPGQEEAAGAR